MRALLTAFGHLTRLPLPGGKIEGRTWGRSLMFFPVVGAVLGGSLSGLGLLGANVMSPVVTAFFCVTVWTWLSAARHLAGLAQTADQWDSVRETQTSTVGLGGAGAAAIALVLLGKLVLLTELLAADASLLLWLVPVAARTAVVPLVALLRHTRSEGASQEMNRHARPGGVVLALLLGAGALWLAGLENWPVMAGAFGAAGALQLWLRQRWKGVSTASLGAAIELAELAGLVCLMVNAAGVY